MMHSRDDKVKKWGCSRCKGDEYEEGDSHRSIRNCDEAKNENIAWEWMPSLRRCPWSQVTEEAWGIIQWWLEYKEFGVLPWGGSDLMEQPAFVLETFTFCTALKNEIEAEKARKDQAKWQQSAKSGSR